MIIMSVFVPVMLFFVAFNVPIPWAIIIYWFINNLWTLVQSLLFIVMVRVRYPLREEHHEARRESHQLFRQRKKTANSANANVSGRISRPERIRNMRRSSLLPGKNNSV